MAIFLRQQNPQSELQSQIAKRLERNAKSRAGGDETQPIPPGQTYDQSNWRPTNPAGFWLVLLGVLIMVMAAVFLLR